MFDELKEVEYLKEITDFNSLRPILDAVLKQGVLTLFQHSLVRLGMPLF